MKIGNREPKSSDISNLFMNVPGKSKKTIPSTFVDISAVRAHFLTEFYATRKQ